MLADQSMHSEREFMQAGHACMLSSYPASIVCLRAKHACRPKYAFGERIHAGTTCLHSCARRAGVGWGLNRKLELRPKRHALIFGGIPSFLVIHPKRKPFSHAFGFGFGKIVVSASELCSVVLIASLQMAFPWAAERGTTEAALPGPLDITGGTPD